MDTSPLQGNAAAPGDENTGEGCTLKGLTLYFLKLGALGFGGPIALAGYMQRDLVDRRRWITRDEYLEGIALSELAPGPLAAQLAIYIGWVRYGVVGATVIGLAFVLPSFLIVLILSALYVRYGSHGWIQGLFYGIGASVIAIIARSAFKLMRLTLGKEVLLWAVCAASLAVTAATESEIVWVFLMGGFAVALIKGGLGGSSIGLNAAAALPPSIAWLATGIKGPAGYMSLWKIFLYFTEAGAFVFGSGLAIVPFLYSGVVKDYQWLTEAQFLDAVAIAMITPGPVVITVGFIGFLAAGVSGALLAAIGVFTPCYLFVVIPAKHFHRYAKNVTIKAFVDGVSSAAAGAIAGAAIILGRRAITDAPTVAIAALTLAILLYTKKIPEPVIIIASGVIGVVIKARLLY